jgi:hypothetical protein
LIRDNRKVTARSPNESLDVLNVARENRRIFPKCCRHDNCVHDVRRLGSAEQPLRLMCLSLAEWSDHAPGEEAPELGLLC